MTTKHLKKNAPTFAERLAQARALSEAPCEVCLDLALKHELRMETVQRLPVAMPPLHMDRRPCCWDCQAASTVKRLFGGKYMDFAAARVAVGNERQDQYRLPGAPLGLVKMGLVRPSAPGDMDDQHAWLYRHNWFDQNPDDED